MVGESLIALLIKRFKRPDADSEVQILKRDRVRGNITYPTRAFDTEYQNTTERPIIVIATIQHIIKDDTEACYALGSVGATSPPTSTDAWSGYEEPPTKRAAVDLILRGQVTFIVPPGYYYKVAETSPAPNVNSLREWAEIEL